MHPTVTYIPFLIALGAFLLLLPICARVRTQAILAMIFLLFASKFVISHYFGGDIYSPELPEVFLLILNWAYAGLLLAFFFAIVWYLTIGLFALLTKRKKLFRLGLWAVIILSWSCAARGIYNGVKVPQIKEVEIEFENLPDNLDGYKILQFTDIHICAAATKWRTEAIVERANSANANLIVVTGDLFDGEAYKHAKDVEPLRYLSARDGVYFIHGNHEFYFDWGEWQKYFDKWGMRFLLNESVSPCENLAIIGVPDVSAPNCALEYPSLTKATKNVPENAFRVLLQHRPYVELTPNEEKIAFDLQLSGHTHGGVAPILRKLVKSYNGGFVSGLYRNSLGQLLYVSPGAGQWVGLPMRFFNDTELTLIVLKKKK